MKGPTLAYIASFTYLIPLLAGISRFEWLDRTMRIFFLLCVWSCVEVFAEYMLSVRDINNAFIINYFLLIDALFLFVLYLFSIGDRRIRRNIFVLALLFICIWIVDKIFFAVPDQMNSEMAVTSQIFIIVASIVVVQAVMKRTSNLLIDEPIFWVAAGYVLYSAGVLVIFGLSNELLKLGPVYFKVSWHINWSLTIVANLMFARVFYCRARRQT
jgi:hypothetical protein